MLVAETVRITKPIYPFNLNPALSIDSDLGPSLRFVEGFAAVIAVLYLLAGAALSGGLLFGTFNQ